MQAHNIHIHLDPALSEDQGYETIRRLKALAGVATVTLSSHDPHYGQIVLHPDSDIQAVLDAALAVNGVTSAEIERLAS